MRFNGKIKRILYILSIILVSAYVASALTTIAQERGGTLIVALISEPTQVVLTSSWNGGFICAQIFDTLLRFDANLNLIPGLAESYEVNSKEGYYRFVIRNGVKWHDGKPLTADDIKFTFENIIPKYTSFGALYFANTTVTIVDPNTIIIKPGKFLPGAQQPLFAACDTTSILPKHILEGQDPLKSDFITTKPVGTGPYKMATWVKGSYMELIRNDDYWDKGKPYLDRIIIRFISDPTTLIANLKRGEVHYVFRGIPYEAVEDLKKTAGLRVIINDRPPYVAALWINVKAGPLSDVRVRQAIAYALNKTDIAIKATYGLVSPVDYMIDPSQVPPSTNIAKYRYDLSIAEKLLDEAGYKRGSDGKRFTIELLTRTGEPDEQIIAQLVRDQLANLGIEVSIKTVDFATYLSLQSRLQYQMATVKYWISTLWTYQLFHSSWIGKGAFTNNFQYANPEVDRLLDNWLVETDVSKQIEYLQRVEDILSRDLPEIVLYRVPWVNVISDKFGGSDIPVGKWVFWDPLINTYMLSPTPIRTPTTPAQAQVTTTPTVPIGPITTTTTPTTQQAPEMPIATYIIIAVVIIVAVALLILRSIRK